MPRLARLSAALALALVLVLGVLGFAACSQVEPVALTVSMPECAYQGPTSMKEGTARLSLTLNGLADVGAALVEPVDGHTYEDIEVHFAENPGWDDRPRWVVPVIELRLDDTEGLDGVAGTADLAPGDYGVICIDHPYDDPPTARVASSLRVAEG